MLDENYQNLYNKIIKNIPKNFIYTDELHTIAYGTDASFYRLVPKIVIKAQNSSHIKAILELATKYNLPVVFRAAGTSLSGQAISDSILVITARTWDNAVVSNDKCSITLQPSITGAKANMALKPFGKKIGPDPASINSAMIGGIAANNASGMCCGISQNSYKTLKSMKIIFYDGSFLDTACHISKDNFFKTHKDFILQLDKYAKDVKRNKTLSAKIQKKFKIKNTCGYSLNALIDFDDVFEVLQHLIIGSEGTLGFIEEITYKTVEDHPQKASALVFFKDTKDACDAVAKLKLSANIKVDAVELMDRSALRSVQNEDGMPSILKTLDNDVTALLIETRSSSKEELDKQTKQIIDLLENFKTVEDEATIIQEIVDNLLMLTKYTKANIKQTFQTVNLDSILLDTISKYNFQLKEKNIKLNLKKFESISLDANSLLITTIFSNLIDNAIKYTPNDKNIYISLYKKDKIYFIIKDEGIGISRKQLSKVVDRFYRVDESRNKKIKGFGLGLSIVKNCVELHDATIEIDSQKNIGTTVKIIL